jgi:hemolysin activation/secretion protein
MVDALRVLAQTQSDETDHVTAAAGWIKKHAHERAWLSHVRIHPTELRLKHFAILALLALCQAALAQRPPSGGGLLPPPAPVPPREEPAIRIEQRAVPPPSGAVQEKILVRSLRVTGTQIYPESELLAVTGFVPGSQLSLADLQGMAARITGYYRRNGYFVAQAFLPAQSITDGAVTIAVSEGRIGKVDLRNKSNLSDRVALGTLRGIDSGDVISTPVIESRLLQLNDLPGVNVRATMIPGASIGTSDLIVEVDPGQRVTGSIDADNAGNRYTGEYRVGATVNLNNPLGLGDVLSLRALTSGSGLQYGRLSYQLQVGRGTVGVAYSQLDYELGREFAALGANGTAQIASVYGRYPVLRSRDNNVYVQMAFDAKTFEDRIDSIPSVINRDVRVLMTSIYGDHRDGFGGGGVSSYFLTWSTGELDIDTPSARADDALTARTQGYYNKLSFSAMRLQRVGGGPVSLYGTINGQLASKNLDVSEKMQLGGMNAVRAYPEGEAYADQGYVVTLEARLDLLGLVQRVPGQVQLIAFVDAGAVTINKNPWAPGGNRRSLSGAGVGVNWADPGNFLVRAYYARKLGNDIALSAPDKSGRFWVQLVKFF